MMRAALMALSKDAHLGLSLDVKVVDQWELGWGRN